MALDSQQISAAPLGRAAKPLVFESAGFAIFKKTAADTFVDWLTQQNLQSTYFLILVSPDGPKVFS